MDNLSLIIFEISQIWSLKSRPVVSKGSNLVKIAETKARIENMIYEFNNEISYKYWQIKGKKIPADLPIPFTIPMLVVRIRVG